MNLELSEEQEELRRQVRRALAGAGGYDALRRLINEDVPYDATLWRQAGELGWLGVTIPEAYGGLGLSAEELCVISEEMGRALAPIPFASSICLAAEAIRLFGTADQKARFLPALATGEMIGAFAAAEGPSSDFDAPGAVLAGGRLSGRKLPVCDGMIADLLVVTARAPDGALVLATVLTDQPGVSRRAARGIDEIRRQAVVEFEGAEAEALAADDPKAALARILDGAAVYTAFEQVGGADACLEMARGYSMERRTFGRLIGSYQALKHRMADMFAKNELARSNAYGAAWALADEAAELPLLAGAARLSAGEAFGFAATENLQIHGGIGYTFEANCHFYYRRARLLDILLGGKAVWSDQVVRGLQARNGAAA